METSLATIFSGASGYWVTWLGMHFVLLLVFLALTYRKCISGLHVACAPC